MKKSFSIFLVLLLVLLSSAFVSGCSSDLFLPFEFEEGTYVSVYKNPSDYKSNNYVMEVDIVLIISDNAIAQEEYDSLLEYFDYYFKPNGDEILFSSGMERQTTNEDLVRFNYKFSSNESFLTGYLDKKEKLFTTTYNITYNKPDTSAITSVLDSTAHFLVSASRRDKVEGGKIVSKDFQYWAMWSDESFSNFYPQVETTTVQMNSFAWFSIALILGGLTLVGLLIFAKKGEGKMIKTPPKRVKRVYYQQQQPPAPPPIDPFSNNNNNIDPFGY